MAPWSSCLTSASPREGYRQSIQQDYGDQHSNTVTLVAIIKQGSVNILEKELWEYQMPKSLSSYDIK